MFVDASAVVAILTYEPEKGLLSAKLESSERVLTSPMAIYEAVMGVARKVNCGFQEARRSVSAFLREAEAETIVVDEAIGHAAIDAFERFGRGRHRAGLNMGDCFAYACAKAHRVPLLCKGDDFIHTDIRIA
jgi:ribonuclease VapC